MTRNRLLAVVAAAAVLLTAACAHLYIGHVKSDDTKTPGFRYYLPRPYLLATSDSAKVVWLPDLSQQYVVQPVCGIGTQKVDLTLDDGWRLTKATSDVDTKVPETVDKVLSGVASVITAVGTLAKPVPTLLRAKTQVVETLPVKSFQLYSIVYNDSGRFVGLESVRVSK